MPSGNRGKRLDALTETLVWYRDLGVTELHLQALKVSAPVGAIENGAVASSTNTGNPLLASDLPALARTVAACRKCVLASTRTQTVFSDGSSSARIMFVGEAPGADEDAQGVPFVGRAGQLLTKMIESGMGMPRSEVYIANVLKCRPPGNRNPELEEIAACRGYLETQIETIRPEVIVALGNFAARFLLGTDEGIMKIRGIWGEYRGTPVMPTYHPSFLLRQPDRKREAWTDLLAVLTRIGLPIPASGSR
jgi:DNA polymerase